MGLLLEPFARRLRRASLPMQVAGTVGLLLAVQSGIALLYPDEEFRLVPKFLKEGGFDLAGAPVQWSDAVTFGVALVATVVLTVVLRKTRAGVATRALVDNDELLALNGIDHVLLVAELVEVERPEVSERFLPRLLRRRPADRSSRPAPTGSTSGTARSTRTWSAASSCTATS